MKKSKQLILLLLLLNYLPSKAQSYFDSLRIAYLSNNTNTINNYDKWLCIAEQINHDSLNADLKQLKILTQAANNEFYTAIYNMHYANNYVQLSGDYQSGLELAISSKTIFEKYNKTKHLILINLNIALFKLWNEIATNNKAKNNSIYKDILEPTLAESKKYGDTNLYVKALNIAASYWIVSKHDNKTALQYFLQSEKLLAYTNDSISNLTTYASLAILFADSNNETQMLQYVNKYLQLTGASSYLYGTCNLYRSVAKYYLNNTKYTTAQEYGNKAYNIALKMNEPEYISLSAKRLYEIYAKQNNKTEALKYLEIHNSTEDKITRHKFDLTYEKLNVESKEKTILSQKLNLQRQSAWLIALLSLLILGIIITYVTRKIKQKNEILRLKNLEQENQLKLDEAVRQTEEDERKRISGNLHDSVAQKLVVLKMNLETLNQNKDVDKAKQELLLQQSKSLIEDTTKEIRTLSHSLMPVNIEKEGLGKAVKEMVRKIFVENLIINVYEYGNLLMLPTHHAILTFRVIQECVQNALKHAMAKEINIHLHCDDNKVEVNIEDDGIGFEINKIYKGVGFTNIDNRIKALNGNLEIESKVGKGTIIIITYPLP
jgi:two-component system, NarL family, sensor kinase